MYPNHIYPTPPLGQDMTQGQFLSGVQQVWIQSFPSPRLAEEPSVPYYLPIAGGRIIGFIPFPRVLVQCEMHSVQDLNSCEPCDDNHYTTGTSIPQWLVMKLKLMIVWLNNKFIRFNGMPVCLGSFNPLGYGILVHCTSIWTFLCTCFLRFYTELYNIKYFYPVLIIYTQFSWLQVSYLIHITIWLISIYW